MAAGRLFLRRVGVPTLAVVAYLTPVYLGARLETGYWGIPKQIEWSRQYEKLYGEVQQLAETDAQRCCDIYELKRILERRGAEISTENNLGINPTMKQLEMAREILLKEKNPQ